MKAVADVDLKNRISHLISSGQLTKTDFGLSNVQNTSDVAKPVSSAQQSALDLKVDKTSVGAVSGVAERLSKHAITFVYSSTKYV